jgi:hypothetical protein
MRITVLVFGLIVLAGCVDATREGSSAAPPPSSAPTAALPSGFPQADFAARGAECIVYLGLSREANAQPAGRDAPIMEQAAGQWRASLEIDGGMTEAEIRQLVASSVNSLTSTPAPLRDAASAWCVDNAPEPDPSR